MLMCPQAHAVTNADTHVQMSTKLHTHAHTQSVKGRLPGHGGRRTEVGPGSCGWLLTSSVCELPLPRASPSTHMGGGVGAGPAAGPQHVSSAETTAGMLCACMCATDMCVWGAGDDAGVHPQHVCTCTLGQPGIVSAHTVCKCAALVDTCTCKKTCVQPAALWTSAGQPCGSPGDHSPGRACNWVPSP